MVIEHRPTGDIFDSGADILVNPVNTVGVMGCGLAAEFKKRFPDNFALYQRLCEAKELQIGTPTIWRTTRGNGEPLCVVNFPTKGHWRNASQLVFITKGMRWLANFLREELLQSAGRKLVAAIPALGCGEGGLPWAKSRQVICSELWRHDLADLRVILYAPRPRL